MYRTDFENPSQSHLRSPNTPSYLQHVANNPLHLLHSWSSTIFPNIEISPTNAPNAHPTNLHHNPRHTLKTLLSLYKQIHELHIHVARPTFSLLHKLNNYSASPFLLALLPQLARTTKRKAYLPEPHAESRIAGGGSGTSIAECEIKEIE